MIRVLKNASNGQNVVSNATRMISTNFLPYYQETLSVNQTNMTLQRRLSTNQVKANHTANSFSFRSRCAHARYASTNSNTPTFVSRQKNSKWVPLMIFLVSFGVGSWVSQQMSFADLVAYWRYDRLPEDSEKVKDYRAKLTARLEGLSTIKRLADEGFVEVFPVRAHGNSDAKHFTTLLDGPLSQVGAVSIPPKFFYKPSTRECVGIYHLGMKLTGYPFIIHGGILATVMEDLMRESIKIINGNPGERTQELTVSYKLPTFANQFVVVRTTKIEEFGKKFKLEVKVEDESGDRLLVRGRGIFETK